MKRKQGAALIPARWERRRYWRKSIVVDVEVWHGSRILPTLPRHLPTIATTYDYCEGHRTRIFADLPCQYCGEKPVPMVVERAGVLEVYR